jgi:hypothetical protein
MVRQLGFISAAISVLVWGGPAGAQAADNDVRCLTVSKFFAATEKDPRRREHARAMAFFFLGRIDARLPPAQLKSQLGAPSALIKQSGASELRIACAKRVQTSQDALLRLGQSVGGSPAKK